MASDDSNAEQPHALLGNNNYAAGSRDQPVVNSHSHSASASPQLADGCHSNNGGSRGAPSTSNILKQANQLLLQRVATTEADRQRSAEEVEKCRRELVASGQLAKPQQEASLLRSTFKVFSKHKRSPSSGDSREPQQQQQQQQEHQHQHQHQQRGCSDPSYFKAAYWLRAKLPAGGKHQPLLLHSSDERAVAMKFPASLQLVESAESMEEPAVVRTVQALLQKCLESGQLCNELFLLLVKQSSWEQGDGYSERVLQLMSAACSLLVPSSALVLAYLRSHLNRSALDTLTDEGRYAQFCLRCLNRAQAKANNRRRFPPSACELLGLFSRSQAHTSVHLLNGDSRQLDFHAFLTGEEALAAVLAKVPLGHTAVGWALYEQFGVMERYTNPADYVGDILFKWEQYGQLSAQHPHQAQHSQQHHHHHHQHHQTQQLRLVCKKRVFVQPFVRRDDHVEVELVTHQCMTDVFEGRIPLDPALARQLCGIRAASESADAGAVLRILPRSWRDQISPDEVAAVAAQLVSLSPGQQLPEAERQHALNLMFLDACQAAPLFGCALFEVRVQCPAELGLECCVLAIGEAGLQLLGSDLRRQPYLSSGYGGLLSFTTENRYLLSLQLVPGGRLALYSKQATQMAYLIRDYMLQLRLLPSPLARSASLANRRRTGSSNSCSVSAANSPRPLQRAHSSAAPERRPPLHASTSAAANHVDQQRKVPSHEHLLSPANRKSKLKPPALSFKKPSTQQQQQQQGQRRLETQL